MGFFYKLWCSTLRVQEYGCDEVESYLDSGKNVVVALWHDELFSLPYKKERFNLITVVSQSRDGDFLSVALKAVGLKTARGSSTRGGVRALLQAAKCMRNEKASACLTIDGPRGPRHKVKDGAVFLAHKAGAYLVPVRVRYHNPKIFHSAWDKFQVPKPFSRVSVYFGEPYLVESQSLDEESLSFERQKLQAKLEKLMPCTTI